MTVQDKPYLFKKGQSGNPKGREKGTLNKYTRDIKALVEEALQRAGENAQKRNPALKGLNPGAAYLAAQAEENPAAFIGLVKQLLPAKIDIDVSIMNRDMLDLLAERRAQLSQMRDITPGDDA